MKNKYFTKKKINFVNLTQQWNEEQRDLNHIIKKIFKEAHFVGGSEVEKFEKNLCKYLKVKYAVALNSGTDALTLSLHLLGIKKCDEVITPPDGAKLLASNPINKVQGLEFQIGVSNIWGIQYHPEITYEKMINLINFRRDRLINFRKVFKNENDIDSHIKNIEMEKKKTSERSRMQELENWLHHINEN